MSNNNGNSKKKNGQIKFNLSLNEEQKRAKEQILNNTITILQGEAGCGKTLTCCQIGLDLLLNKQVQQIIITRPQVSVEGEEMGFLPGNLYDKTLPFLIPLYDNMYNLLNKPEIDSLILDNSIQICPVAFLRGRTFANCFVIIDEAQNLTTSQLRGLMTRLGINGKMVICGDMSQCDLKSQSLSGFPSLTKLSPLNNVKFVTLIANHRHSIVTDILQLY